MPLIDCAPAPFILIAVMVLMTFSSACGAPAATPAHGDNGNGSGTASPPHHADAAGLPITFHGIEGAPSDAVVVATKAGVISVDGVKVADAPKAPAGVAKKPPARIDGLFQALNARADAWKKAHPGESLPGRVAFTFDSDEIASTVKNVASTAASAGYSNGALLVRTTAKTGGELAPSYLNMGVVRIDAEKAEKADRDRDRELQLKLSSHGVVLLKWHEGNKVLGETMPSGLPVAKLAVDIGRGWNERGLHREPNDKRFDQAVLHVDNDTPYTLIVVTLDAVHATKRKLENEEPVQAIKVSLALD